MIAGKTEYRIELIGASARILIIPSSSISYLAIFILKVGPILRLFIWGNLPDNVRLWKFSGRTGPGSEKNMTV